MLYVEENVTCLKVQFTEVKGDRNIFMILFSCKIVQFLFWFSFSIAVFAASELGACCINSLKPFCLEFFRFLLIG